MNYFLLIAILFNYIFPLRPVGFPYLAEFIYAITLFWLISRLVRKDGIGLVSNRRGLRFLLFVTVLTLVCGTSTLINGTGDLGMLQVFANFTFAWVYAAILIAGVRVGAFGRNITYENILAGIVVSASIVGITVFMEVFSPQMKGLFSSLISKSGNIVFAESYRASGIAAGGGASLSFAMSVSCGLALIMAIRTDKQAWKVACSLSAFSLLIATIFVGRTGMLLAIVFFLASLRYLSFGRLFNLIVTALAVVWVAWSFTLDMSGSALEYYQVHSFEFFNNYLETGQIGSKSSTAVADMYFIPQPRHLLLGAGYISGSHFGYPSVDPGYLRVLLAGGVVGFGLFYSGCIGALRSAYKGLAIYAPRQKALIVILLLSYFVFEAKEPGLYQNYGFRILAVLSVYLFIYRARSSPHRNESLAIK